MPKSNNEEAEGTKPSVSRANESSDKTLVVETDTDSDKEDICFIAMPIADFPPYEDGHFKRVYNHIIKPACIRAGFKPIRADDVNRTNFIILDILRQVIESPMMLVDLSGRNPNVMYEMGIRQAFDLPLTLIKDEATNRIFDIQGMRDVPYSESLRVDSIEPTIEALSQNLRNTYENHGKHSMDINSIVSLLSIKPAKKSEGQEISQESSILLSALNGIGQRLSAVESALGTDYVREFNLAVSEDGRLGRFKVGDKVHHDTYGNGTVVKISGTPPDLFSVVRFESGRLIRIHDTSPKLRYSEET